MYTSPIELIYGNIETQMAKQQEDFIFEAIRKVGVDVDRAELIKALQYDRQQYEKGFADGIEEGKRQAFNDMKNYLTLDHLSVSDSEPYNHYDRGRQASAYLHENW